MTDIAPSAEICREEFPGVLQIRNTNSDRLTAARHPRALAQQLDNATGNA
jgi:hypothetical protein